MKDREKLVELFGELPFETLVSDIRDFAVFHLDTAGTIRSWNAGAELITGFTAHDAVGSSFRLLFTPEDIAAGVPEKELEKAARDGRAEDRRWHVRKNDSRYFADGVTTALRAGDGSLSGFAKIARDATETKLTEDALFESNRKSVNILESISDAFYALDNRWRFSYVNKQAERLLQRTAEDLIGKNIWEEFPDAVGREFYKQYHRALRERVAVSFEEYYPAPLDGWFELWAYPSEDGLSVYFRNITERRNREEGQIERSRTDALIGSVGNALVESRDLKTILDRCVTLLVEDLDVAFARIWTLNAETNTLELQASAGLYTHLDGEHSRVPVGKFKIGTIAAERTPHLTNDVQNDALIGDHDWAVREGMTSFAGYPMVVDDRLVGVIAVFARRDLPKATLDALSAVSQSIAVAIERKYVESALLRSEEQYRVVAETASDAILSIDENSIIQFINGSSRRIFGYEPDEMIGKNLTMIMPPNLRGRHEKGLSRYLQSGERKLNWEHVEIPAMHRDGHEIPLELSFGESRVGGRSTFIGIARDVSARKESEERVRESEAKFATLAEAVPQLVWMAEPDGFIFWYNRNWYDYTGTTPEDMEGWGWQAVHDPEILPSVIERWTRSIETGTPFEMEFPLRSAAGEFRWFLTRVNPLRDDDGKIIRWFGTNTDIDEQRRLDLRNRFVIGLDEAVRPLTDPREITHTLARMLGEYLHADRCAYAEVEPDEDHFYIPGDYMRGSVKSIVGRYAMSDFGDEVLRLMRANQPYIVHDVDNDPQVTEEDLAAYRLTDIKAVICVPLHKNGRFSACMAVHQTVPRRWRDDEIELVAFVANRFWEAIERARILKSLEDALAREMDARRVAEDANRIKDEFLATVSHELRTPLNAILGWSNMLRSGKMGEAETERALQTVERNARSQARLIDDLLDISRIITGKLRLEIATVDMNGVIEAAVDAVRPAADANNIRIATQLDTVTGPISGDAARLQQVVWNLLSNAVKFTPKGGRIDVAMVRVESHVEISVSDTGKGIAPEFLPYVFDRFRQADQTRTRSQGGLGLGLSIVRQLVEMHGGAVDVRSEGEGKGSTFIVKLPRLAAYRPAPADGDRPHVMRTDDKALFDCPPELHGLRVLIVDDEIDSLDLIHEILKQCGAHVETANSAAEAFGLINTERFDVLVSDIGMPGEDGYSLIKKIRALPPSRGGDTPAIALTAYARVEDRIQSLTAGFQGHVAKPVEPDELAAFVASLARRPS